MLYSSGWPLVWGSQNRKLYHGNCGVNRPGKKTYAIPPPPDWYTIIEMETQCGDAGQGDGGGCREDAIHFLGANSLS